MKNKIIIGISIIFLLIIIAIGFATQIIDDTQDEFNLGNYNNTLYNGSAVVLSGANTSGTYTSRIFDAGSNARWDDITITRNLQTKEYIYAVDNTADVWNSPNQGTNWNLVKDDYNGADSNGVTEIFFNSSGAAFIIYNQNIWRSLDMGLTWTKINDNYNGAEVQNAYVAAADKNNNLYIIEGDQDVWKSTDSGATWIKISTDFNGGNGNFGGLVADSSNNLFAVDLASDIWKSNDYGVTWTLVKDDYNGGAGNNADGMAIDKNNNMYILDVQDVWKSTDLGVSWTKINDDFNGGSDSEAGQSIAIDSSNNVYAIDGGEDVFKSTDGGVTFTKVATNFNGASGNAPTMASILKNTSLILQARNCSSADCSDGVFVDVSKNLNNMTGRYFQYKLFLSSQEAGITPDISNIMIDYAILNQNPVVSSINLIPASPKTNDDLTCSFIVTDNDFGDSLTANITWHKNNAVYSSTSQIVTNGTEASSILDASNTLKNEEWNCTIIPYDGKTYGAALSAKVTIQNSPPSTPNTSLIPASPYTNDDLNVIFNQLSQDNDSDTVTYSYKWYKNNVYQPGISGSTVSSGVTSKNDIWKVNITPNDGTIDGIPAEKNITILNSKPSITSVSISPTIAYKSTTLTAAASGWSDLDNEAENYIYQWFNQSGKITGATSSTLTGAYFKKGDQIQLNITPYDSDEYGSSILSSAITIKNSAPVISSITITTSSIFNSTDDSLTGTFAASDDDNDLMQYNEIKWYKNSIEQISLTNLSVIGPAYTTTGELWIFSARVYDGENYSIWHNSSQLLIMESPAIPSLATPSNNSYINVSYVLLAYSTPYRGGVMNCSIYANESYPPSTTIKTNNNLNQGTTLLYNWVNIVDSIYYWKVSCINSSGINVNSTINVFTIDTIPPSSAPILSQENVSDSDNDGNIEISWTADGNALTYNIYRSSTQITDASGLTKIGSSSLTSFKDNTTSHGSIYWYAITSVDAAGNENKSVVSNSFSASANDTIKPKLPTNLTLSSFQGTTTIRWNKASQDINGNNDEIGMKYKIWYVAALEVNLSKSLVNETATYINTISNDSCSENICETSHSLSGSAEYYYFVTTIDDGSNENLGIDNSEENKNYNNVTATLSPPRGDTGGSGAGGGGGGGSGTGGSSRLKTTKKCSEDWSCSDWYACTNGMQGRTCIDVNGCGTKKNKPAETRECQPCAEDWQCGEWTECVNNRQTRSCADISNCKTENSKPEEEKECAIESCSDGIKNYGEVGIDCGGPCKACSAKDFITGGAISLEKDKKLNRALLIPTIILLVIFIIAKNIKAPGVKLKKILSIIHLPFILVIAALFVFSFAGFSLTGENSILSKIGNGQINKDKTILSQITGFGPSQREKINPEGKKTIIASIIVLIIALSIIGTNIFKRRIQHKDIIREISRINSNMLPKEKPAAKQEIKEEKINIAETNPLNNNKDDDIISINNKQEIIAQLKDIYKIENIK